MDQSSWAWKWLIRLTSSNSLGIEFAQCVSLQPCKFQFWRFALDVKTALIMQPRVPLFCIPVRLIGNQPHVRRRENFWIFVYLNSVPVVSLNDCDCLKGVVLKNNFVAARDVREGTRRKPQLMPSGSRERQVMNLLHCCRQIGPRKVPGVVSAAWWAITVKESIDLVAEIDP